jgi:Uracil DNA glycosylase superfamily
MDRLPDQLQCHLRLVFVGTAAGQRSADLGHYYAHPGNRFWRTMHEVGLTPRRYQPPEFPALLALGIGFTDLCKVGAGMDHEALKAVSTFRRWLRKCGDIGRRQLPSPARRRRACFTAGRRERCARPATAADRFSRSLRAGLAIRRRIGRLVAAAVAGYCGLCLRPGYGVPSWTCRPSSPA